MATTPGCKKNQVRTASEDSNEDAPRPVTNPQNLLEDQSESSGAHKLYRELVRECPLVSAASADRIVNTPLVNSSEIEQEWLLGSGSFCQVHRVRIPQLMDHSCCLKSLRPNIDPSLRTDAQVDLWYEGYLLEKLPPHPNLICLVGHSTSGGILLEEMKSGDLHKVLVSLRKQHKQQFFSNLLQAPQVNQRLRDYALGIARGLAHLHSHDIVLRDLKPSNIGLQRHPNGQSIPKLLDLGLSRHVERIPSTDHGGSLRYMAPELFGGAQSATLDSDVYSFAISLWEICTLQQSYSALMQYPSKFQTAVQKGRRPPLSKIASPRLRKLLSKCWHADPSKRPKMSEVVQDLESVLSYQTSTTRQPCESKGASNTEPKKIKSAWKHLLGFGRRSSSLSSTTVTTNNFKKEWMTRQTSTMTTMVSESETS